MKKLVFVLVIITIFGGLLVGCGHPDMKGIVLEVNDEEIKLAEGLSIDKYEEIKDESVKALQNEDVAGERESLKLIDITYDHAEDFSKGDEVEVWIDGDIMSSYPGKADAKKISKKK